MTTDIIEEVEQAAREAIAALRDEEGAPHTAECIRSGKWDGNGEIQYSLIGARAAARVVLERADDQINAFRENTETEAADMRNGTFQQGYAFAVKCIHRRIQSLAPKRK